MTKKRDSVVVRQRVRPLRFAFFVALDDIEFLKQSIAASTCQWGGQFNGLVPLLRRVPRWWWGKPGSTTHEIHRGYVDAFEPDFVVAKDPSVLAAETLGLEDWQILGLDDVLAAGSNSNHVGIDVSDIYQELYERVFQFKRRRETRGVRPIAKTRQIDLLLGAVAGILPEHAPHFRSAFDDIFDAHQPEVDGSNLHGLLEGALTPIQVGRTALTITRRGKLMGPTLFFMDSRRAIDVVDFWNLRALGVRVIPVATGFNYAGPEEFRSLLPASKDFIGTTILKSRSVSSSAFEAFASKFGAGFTIQDWFPRMWSAWGREADRVERCVVSNREESSEQAVDDGRISFTALAPRFVARRPHTGRAKWVTAVSFRRYGSHLSADVLPRGIRQVDRLLETYQFQTSTINSEGVVVRCTRWDDVMRCSVPTGPGLLSVLAHSLDADACLSEKGEIVLALLEAVGGLTGARIFAREEVVELLDSLAHGTVESGGVDSDGPKPLPMARTRKPLAKARTISRDKLLGLLRKSQPSRPKHVANNHLDRLLEAGMLRVGLQVPCPRCRRQNWYALDRISQDLRCEVCTRAFPFPQSPPPPASDWVYRTQGVFSVENYAQGGYAVVLALRFLINGLRAAGTPVPNFVLTRKGEEIEVDFAIWWRPSSFWYAEPRVIFGECKTHRAFESEDYQRAKKLAAMHPGAVLVFATLKETLTPVEKRRIGALARWGRRSLGSDTWRAPVAVLTKNELFAEDGPTTCWVGKGDKFSAVLARYSRSDGLEALCDATQQLYLDLEPYS